MRGRIEYTGDTYRGHVLPLYLAPGSQGDLINKVKKFGTLDFCEIVVEIGHSDRVHAGDFVVDALTCLIDLGAVERILSRIIVVRRDGVEVNLKVVEDVIVDLTEFAVSNESLERD